MNIELYIQSGIVESYVLGLATPQEIAEFEQLLPHFPELGEAKSDFEYQLELFSIDHEVPPPPGMRGLIEARVKEIPATPVTRERGGYQRRHARSGPNYIPVEVSSPFIKVHKNWRTFLIAFFVFAKILLILSIYYFVETRHLEKQVMRLEEQLGKKEAR